VWGEELTDRSMWTAITETKNHKEGYHSFMIKVIRKDYVLIKATPRYGLHSKDSAEGSATGGRTPDEDPHDYGHYGGGGSGKGYGRGYYGATDGKTRAPWRDHGAKGGAVEGASVWAAGFEAGAKKTKEAKEVDNEAGPKPDDKSTPAGDAPKEWFVGQQTPSTYTIQGVVDSWKTVQAGEKCPWDARIAKCTKQEYNMGKQY
jgi:hypothetical protein